jgi:hypothetical protein
MARKKQEGISLEETTDIVLFKQVKYEEALRISEDAKKKGWLVKSGQRDFLKKGNNL